MMNSKNPPIMMIAIIIWFVAVTAGLVWSVDVLSERFGDTFGALLPLYVLGCTGIAFIGRTLLVSMMRTRYSKQDFTFFASANYAVTVDYRVLVAATAGAICLGAGNQSAFVSETATDLTTASASRPGGATIVKVNSASNNASTVIAQE